MKSTDAVVIFRYVVFIKKLPPSHVRQHAHMKTILRSFNTFPEGTNRHDHTQQHSTASLRDNDFSATCWK
jgi:hypothetical protein